MIALNSYLGLGYDLYYWRTSNDREVDFVLYGKKGIKVFEVKRSGRLLGDALKNLKTFLADYPIAQAYLVYGGDRRMKEGNIAILPMVDCLGDLPSILSYECLDSPGKFC